MCQQCRFLQFRWQRHCLPRHHPNRKRPPHIFLWHNWHRHVPHHSPNKHSPRVSGVSVMLLFFPLLLNMLQCRQLVRILNAEAPRLPYLESLRHQTTARITSEDFLGLGLDRLFGLLPSLYWAAPPVMIHMSVVAEMVQLPCADNHPPVQRNIQLCTFCQRPGLPRRAHPDCGKHNLSVRNTSTAHQCP